MTVSGWPCRSSGNGHWEFYKNAKTSAETAFQKLALDLFDIIGLNDSAMKRAFLGEFEEVVLLTVAVLSNGGDQAAYGVTITQELEAQTGRSVGFSTVHTTLQRLEEKGYLSSRMGGATTERGGRRKRFFTVTAAGRTALHEVRQVRTQLWNALPAHFQIA